MNLIPVRFEISHPTAIPVCVAGTLNDLNLRSGAPHSSGVGDGSNYEARAPGAYEYCLMVHEGWIPDPYARKNSGQSIWRQEFHPGSVGSIRDRTFCRRHRVAIEKCQRAAQIGRLIARESADLLALLLYETYPIACTPNPAAGRSGTIHRSCRCPAGRHRFYPLG